MRHKREPIYYWEKFKAFVDTDGTKYFLQEDGTYKFITKDGDEDICSKYQMIFWKIEYFKEIKIK